MEQGTEAMTPLPQYQSHKKVWALKIKNVLVLPLPPDAATWLDGAFEAKLEFEDPSYLPRTVSGEWLSKHKPEPGGYWVQYASGYESYCPGPEFEEGNLLITAAMRVPPATARHQSFSKADLDNWFSYHAPSAETLQDYHAIRTAAKIFAETINKHVPAGADKSDAMRKLRETTMMANAGIACAAPPSVRPAIGLAAIENAVNAAESRALPEALDRYIATKE